MKKQKQQTEIVVPGVKKYGARKRNWDVEHHGKNIHVVSVKRPKMKDFEQWILLLADNHHDNPSEPSRQSIRRSRDGEATAG